MSEPFGVLVKELGRIFGGVGKGLLSVVIPPPPTQKIQWCRCRDCGKWHVRGS